MSKYFGIYRARVINVDDPQGRGRVIAQIPQVLGDAPSAWCEPIVPTIYKHAIGDTIWVMFLDGDPTLPVFQPRPEVVGSMIAPGTIDLGAFNGNIYKVFYQGSTSPGIPTSVNAGDIWIDTDDNDKMYVATSIGATTIGAGQWVLTQDSAGAYAYAGTKAKVFYQGTIPTSIEVGDVWVDTADNNKMYIAESIGATTIAAGQWVLAQDSHTAQQTANQSVYDYYVEYAVNNSDTVAPTTGWSTAQPTRTPGQFIWFRATSVRNDSTQLTTSPALMTGNDGATGAPGADAAYIILTATTQLLTSPAGGGATTPTTAVVSGTGYNTTISVWEYSVDGGAFSATVPAGVSRTGNDVTITGSTMTAKTITVRMSDGTVSDTLTVAKNYDGAAGATGPAGADGTNGADAYTVLLTNESHTFPGSTSAAQAGSTVSQVVAYQGSTAQSVTIGTITGAPTGMTTSIQNNSSTSAQFTVTVTTSLTTQSGTLTVPVTVGGISYTKKFSWSVSYTGQTGSTGATGATGVSVSSISQYFAQVTIGTGPPANPSGATPAAPWSSTEPGYVAGTELWRSDKITFSDASYAYTSVYKSSSYTAATDAQDRAIRSQYTNTNPTFSDWTGTYPAGYVAWNGAPTKDTTNTRVGSYAVQYLTDGTGQFGMSGGTEFDSVDTVNGYVTAEIDVMLKNNGGAITTATFLGAGLLLDWGSGTYRNAIHLATYYPSPVFDRWYQLKVTVPRPSGGGTDITGGYLMADWTGFAAAHTKQIIFDKVGVRAATDQEIKAYLSASQADLDATNANVALKNRVYRQTSAPTGGSYTQGDIWFDTTVDASTGTASNTPYVYVTGTGWVAAQDVGIPLLNTLVGGINSQTTTNTTDIDSAGTDISTLQSATTSTSSRVDLVEGMVTLSDYVPSATDAGTRADGAFWITRTRARQNLCENPSFETNLTGWTANAATTTRVVNTPPVSGGYGMQVTNSASGTHWVSFPGSGTYGIPALPGQNFTSSAYLQLESGSGAGAYLEIEFFNSAGTSLGATQGTTQTLVTGDWVRVDCTAQAPSNTAYVKAAKIYNPNNSAVWQVDAVLIEASTYLGRYFDGDSYDGSWDGTAEASTSQLGGQRISDIYELRNGGWLQLYFDDPALKEISADRITSGLMSGSFLTDGTVAVDKLIQSHAVASEALTAGNLVNVYNDAGVFLVRKASSTSGYEANGFVLSAYSAGATATIYTYGYNPLVSGLTPGPVYLSTSGGVTSNPSTSSGVMLQQVGFAPEATTLVFHPYSPINIT